MQCTFGAMACMPLHGMQHAQALPPRLSKAHAHMKVGVMGHLHRVHALACVGDNSEQLQAHGRSHVASAQAVTPLHPGGHPCPPGPAPCSYPQPALQQRLHIPVHDYHVLVYMKLFGLVHMCLSCTHAGQGGARARPFRVGPALMRAQESRTGRT